MTRPVHAVAEPSSVLSSAPHRAPLVLALTGSPRRGGNTDQVTAHVGQLVEQAGLRFETIHLREVAVAGGCGECGDCNVRTKPCGIGDGVAGVVARMVSAAAIVYAAPVHGFGLATPMQSFIERAGVGHLRFRRPLSGKVGLPVVTGRRYSHEHVHHQLMNNMLLNRMILAGSGLPAIVHGGAPGSIWRDTEGIANVEAATRRLCSLVDLLAAAGAAGIRLEDHSLASNERLEQPSRTQPPAA